MYSKVRRTSLTTIFSVYGAAVATWNLLIFFHRNAPSKDLSHLLFRFSLPIFSLLGALIILLLSYIYKEKVEYWLVLLIPVFFTIIFSFSTPFKIVSTRYGWSYFFISKFGILANFSLFLGIIGAIIIGFYLHRKVSTKVESQRIKLIVISVGGIYLGGIAVTNIILMVYPYFPPFGGILTTAEFLVIAYAVTLSPQKVHIKEEGDRKDLQSLYINFIREFQRHLPDKRLGKSEIFLKESLEAMGLDDLLVWDEKGNVLVDNKIIEEDEGELVDTALRGMKQLPIKENTLESYSPIMNLTYKKMKNKDAEKAELWRSYILKQHGPFLNKMAVLQKIKFIQNNPSILRGVRDKRLSIKAKDKPLEIYEQLDSIQRLGYYPKCVTKYKKSKVRAKVGFDFSNIIEIMDYIDTEENSFSTEDLLSDIEDYWDLEENSILIIDCISMVMSMIGEDKSLEFLGSLQEKTECNLVIVYNKEIMREYERKLSEIKSWSR